VVGTQQTVNYLTTDVMCGAPVHFFNARRIVALLNVSDCGQDLDLDTVRPTTAIYSCKGLKQCDVVGLMDDLHVESRRQC